MSEQAWSRHERTAATRSLSYGNCLSLLRQIAAEDLGVPSEASSLLELLQDVYRQGGHDATSGLQAMAQTMGPALTAAVLGVDWSGHEFPTVHRVDLSTDPGPYTDRSDT